MTRICGALLVSALLAAPASAQHEEHAGAGTTEQLGTVDFETSCAPAVRADFNRAVALLHSFWFPEGLKAFNDVLQRDPSCTIAYWGIALSLWNNPHNAPPAPNLAPALAAIRAWARCWNTFVSEALPSQLLLISGIPPSCDTISPPGISAAVVLADGTSYSFAAGMADREAGRAMQPGDRMMQGSVGKTYVAAVALQLVTENKLDLDAPISRWLGDAPWFDRLIRLERHLK